MRPEDYKMAMDSLIINENKYDELISAIESDRYRARRITVPAAAAAFSLAAVLGVTAAAESGAFNSMRTMFRTDDANMPIAAEPSDYAFMPDVEPVSADGVTVKITEVAADDHNAAVFMDLAFENGDLNKLLKGINTDNADFSFEEYGTAGGMSSSSTRFVSMGNNTISMCIITSGNYTEDWFKNGMTVGWKNFGYYAESNNAFCDFKTLVPIEGSVIIPPEQIKRNKPKVTHKDIDGVSMQAELSILGFNIILDSTDDFDKLDGKIVSHKGGFPPSEVQFFMKDGRVYGDGKGIFPIIEMLESGSIGTDDEGRVYLSINFCKPVDTEIIDKITINGYEFDFE